MAATYETDEATGCWNWLGYVNSRSGYGEVGRGGRKYVAHRFIYESYRGPVERGKQLHHECGNRACVNPEHLRVVSASEHKRLHPNRRGPFRPKLDPLSVREIRARAAAGESQSAIARSLGISHVSVNAVVHRRTWAHVA